MGGRDPGSLKELCLARKGTGEFPPLPLRTAGSRINFIYPQSSRIFIGQTRVIFVFFRCAGKLITPGAIREYAAAG